VRSTTESTLLTGPTNVVAEVDTTPLVRGSS
jgi:hypothetical protein